jgi:hypothetical protein
MQNSKLILVALCLTAFAAVQAEENYAALFDEAIKAIDWEFENEWAFTETSLSGEQLLVRRYDPRLDNDKRWSLISVDGHEPTVKEVKNYARDKDDRGDLSDSSTTGIVDADSLKLLEETDDYWLFTFVPDEDEEVFTENVDAKIKIIKAGHYLESIDIRNHSEIKAGFGTKISKFVMRFEFGPAAEDGPIVPQSIKMHVTGRALLFIGFDETEVTSYKDFEYAGDQVEFEFPARPPE